MSEFAAALAHAALHGHPLTTLVSHSFELATRDGRRPNTHVQRRFEALCALLGAHRAVLPTTHIASLADLPLGVDAEPLRSSRTRTFSRRIEQAWTGVRHEKPGETASAATAACCGGLELFVPLLGL